MAVSTAFVPNIDNETVEIEKSYPLLAARCMFVFFRFFVAQRSVCLCIVFVTIK